MEVRSEILGKMEDLLRKKIALAVTKAKVEMRARCAASAYVDCKNMLGSGKVRDAILALPLDSDGSEMTQTKRAELEYIKLRAQKEG